MLINSDNMTHDVHTYLCVDAQSQTHTATGFAGYLKTPQTIPLSTGLGRLWPVICAGIAAIGVGGMFGDWWHASQPEDIARNKSACLGAFTVGVILLGNACSVLGTYRKNAHKAVYAGIWNTRKQKQQVRDITEFWPSPFQNAAYAAF